MRYQDSRENRKQHRYNQYSYRPYDAMKMDKEKMIREMVFPSVMRLAAAGGYYALGAFSRKCGIPIDEIMVVLRSVR